MDLKKSNTGKFIICILGALALVLLDRLSKLWAENVLRPKGTVVLIKGVLEFSYTQNTGIAFGLFQGLGVVFVILTVLLSVVLIFLLWKTPAKKHFLPLNIIFTLILGGALGNLWDRVFQSYVTDFIYIRLINFPIFNVADICVSLGIAALLFYLLFFYKDNELKEVFSLRKKKEEAAHETEPLNEEPPEEETPPDNLPEPKKDKE